MPCRVLSYVQFGMVAGNVPSSLRLCMLNTRWNSFLVEGRPGRAAARTYEVARGPVQATVWSRRGGSSSHPPTDQSREGGTCVPPGPFRSRENPPPLSPVYVDVI